MSPALSQPGKRCDPAWAVRLCARGVAGGGRRAGLPRQSAAAWEREPRGLRLWLVFFPQLLRVLLREPETHCQRS
jgi:hypothetical protein